uniref:Uncharacterized protein n=1 Tax=Peronospora matthiolae TaxID=2874970 RepID=A0AAV1UVQ7_9STRA
MSQQSGRDQIWERAVYVNVRFAASQPICDWHGVISAAVHVAEETNSQVTQ